MADSLVPGMIATIKAKERLNVSTCLRITDLVKKGDKYNCTWSDGKDSIYGVLGSQPSTLVDEGALESGGLVRALEYVCNEVAEKGPILGVFKMEVISKSEPPKAMVKGEPLSVKMEGEGDNSGPLSLQRAQSVMTPRCAKENAVLYKTPAAKIAEKHSGTPGFTPPSTGHKALQPIQALNPYNNNWTIKARVSNKTPLRSSSRNGQPFSVFSINLVDEQGTEIEATLWREMADQWYEKLQEGKVYFFTKGRVKPANKNYSTARNDYSIDFQNETLINECVDEDPSKMQAKISFVRFDQLGTYIGRKTLVDVIGVVKEAQPLGSVKRKADGVDLPRRDVTLVDQSGKMVKVTIWGAQAQQEGAELEALSNPIVAISAVKVGDYDGVSLSSVSRSGFQINPETKEAEELQTWWNQQGSIAEFCHAGEGLASARKGADGRSSDERGWLKEVVKDQLGLPPPDAKPEFFNIRAWIMQIDPDQTPFFYTADAATGKKVIADGDGWRFAADDKPCLAMERRYFMRISLMDPTGSCDVMLSNDQAEKLLGRKADELHQMKESNTSEFQAVLSAAQFTEWTVVIKSNTSEYRGELRQRLQGYGKFSQQDFTAESKWLLSKIKSLAT